MLPQSDISEQIAALRTEAKSEIKRLDLEAERLKKVCDEWKARRRLRSPSIVPGAAAKS